MSDVRDRTSAQAAAPRAVPHVWVWLIGPVLLLVFSGALFASAYMLATRAGSAPLDGGSWHGALEVLAAIGKPGLKDFHAIAAAVGAFVIAAAAATNFGAQERRVALETRRAAFACLVIGALVLVVVATLTIPVAIVEPHCTVSVLTAMAVTWTGLLIIQAVRRSSDRSEREEDLRQARCRVADLGYDPDALTQTRGVWWRTIVLFVVPFALWATVVVFFTLVARRLGSAWWTDAFALLAVVYYPNLFLTITWRVTADASASRDVSSFIRVCGLILVGVSVAAVVIALVNASPFALAGWLLLVFTLCHTLTLFVRTRPRSPLLRAIEERVTARSLKRREAELDRGDADRSGKAMPVA